MKANIKSICLGGVFENICSENFLQVIIKASVTEFIFS